MNGFAQAPDTLWTRTYGSAEINELGQSVNPTKNGGFIIVGVKNHGTENSSIWLIKTNSHGDTTWTKSYGGYGSPAYSTYVEQTTDDGYIISGYIAPYNGDKYYQLWLLKTDDAGDTTWTLTYGGSGLDQGRSVQQTADGGYIVTGNTGSGDLLLLKTNSIGEISWTKTYGGDKEDYGNAISLTNDGGYIISGWSSSNTISENNGFWLIKTNSAGDSSWTLLLEGNNIAAAWSAEQTKDNGYICTGHNGNNKIWLVKVDAEGDTTWTKSFGNKGTSQGRDVKETSDGGYIITGFTELYGANERDLWIIKTDSFGNKLWDKIIANQYDDYGVSIQQTFDDRYLIAGYTETDGSGKYDVWLVRLEADQEGIKYKWHVTSSGSDITGDGSESLPFLTIQNGINYASDGDTVLVHPGIYVENINYNGKNIVVGSLTLTTGDTSYISQTIIDGNQNWGVVKFENGEDSTATLNGFKITNGSYLGISCSNSNPTISDCIVTKNGPTIGRGISCTYSSPSLIRLKITDNDNIGIALMDQSSPLIEDSEISDNNGSGIYCNRQCSPNISNVIIK
ncbi:right-handed parallel beta-helix repeat-containing protein, partial [Patescibacteria group bacterium]|nr:right-handed parallel beta-helix repeat-containing protein [Patescibacteria group bacterium]